MRKQYFLTLKIVSLLLLIIAITNCTIKLARADGNDETNSSSEIINLDQSLHDLTHQSSQSQTLTHIEGGIHRDFPENFNSENNSLFCYMETEDGKTLNLIEICGHNSDQN